MTMSFRPSGWTLFRVLIVPTIVPGILTAWKINLGNAARVVVVAELVGATGGVGYELLRQQQLFDMAGALAWTIQLVLFVLVVQQIIVLDRELAAALPAGLRAGGVIVMTEPLIRFQRRHQGVPPARRHGDLHRGRPPVVRHRQGRDRRRARQDRLRQVDHVQPAGRPDRADQRQGRGHRARSVPRVQLLPRQDRHRVPERPADAVAHGARQRRARPGNPRRQEEAKPRSIARRWLSRLGPVGPRERLSACALRRHAPARVDRARLRGRAGHPAVRRAVLLARRDDRARPARRVRPPGEAERQDRGVHHPSHQRGDGRRRPHHGVPPSGADRLRGADGRGGARRRPAGRFRTKS